MNRIQSVDETDAIVRACRAQGFRSVNIDLIYGLPGQTTEGFGRTLDTVIAMRPDRIALYSYAHLPAMFKAHQRIAATELPGADSRITSPMPCGVWHRSKRMAWWNPVRSAYPSTPVAGCCCAASPCASIVIST